MNEIDWKRIKRESEELHRNLKIPNGIEQDMLDQAAADNKMIETLSQMMADMDKSSDENATTADGTEFKLVSKNLSLEEALSIVDGASEEITLTGNGLSADDIREHTDYMADSLVNIDIWGNGIDNQSGPMTVADLALNTIEQEEDRKLTAMDMWWRACQNKNNILTSATYWDEISLEEQSEIIEQAVLSDSAFDSFDDTKLRIVSTLIKNHALHIEQESVVALAAGFSESDVIVCYATAFAIKYSSMYDIASFQPMTGPVGMYFNLVRVLKDENDSAIQQEILEVQRGIVDAKTVMFPMQMSIELVQDMTHGLLQSDSDSTKMDVIREVGNILGIETAAEYDNNMLQTLLDNADESEIYPFIEGALDVIWRHVTTAVATDSHRGTANWVVVNPIIYEMILKEDGHDGEKAFTRATGADDNWDSSSALTLMGTLWGKTKVYLNTNETYENVILGGYSGMNLVDRPITFAPYLHLSTTGILVDPESFQPTMRFKGRFGMATHKDIKKYVKAIKLID